MHTFEYSFESNFGQEEGVAHLRTGRNMTSLPYSFVECGACVCYMARALVLLISSSDVFIIVMSRY